MDSALKSELAYLLSREIDCETFHKLEHEDTHNDLRRVAQKLIETHTPSWIYYHLYQSDASPYSAEPVLAFLDDETIQEVAEEYAELDQTPINLAKPGSYDWMQEDPMEPHREEYENKLNAIRESIEDAANTYLEGRVSDETVNAFVETTVDKIEPLEWWANKHTKDATDEEVAEMFFAAQGEFSLAITLTRIQGDKPKNPEEVRELEDELDLPETQDKYIGDTLVRTEELQEYVTNLGEEINE